MLSTANFESVAQDRNNRRSHDATAKSVLIMSNHRKSKGTHRLLVTSSKVGLPVLAISEAETKSSGKL